MIQTPGKHTPTIKNRSSKHLYFLTKSGMSSLNKWNKEKGIHEYNPPKTKKDAKKNTSNSKKQENAD